jgi:hypothetical protein
LTVVGDACIPGAYGRTRLNLLGTVGRADSIKEKRWAAMDFSAYW